MRIFFSFILRPLCFLDLYAILRYPCSNSRLIRWHRVSLSLIDYIAAMVNRRRGYHVQPNNQEEEAMDPRSFAWQFAEAMIEAFRSVHAPRARGTSVVMDTMHEFWAMNPFTFDNMGEPLEEHY